MATGREVPDLHALDQVAADQVRVVEIRATEAEARNGVMDEDYTILWEEWDHFQWMPAPSIECYRDFFFAREWARDLWAKSWNKMFPVLGPNQWTEIA